MLPSLSSYSSSRSGRHLFTPCRSWILFHSSFASCRRKKVKCHITIRVVLIPNKSATTLAYHHLQNLQAQRLLKNINNNYEDATFGTTLQTPRDYSQMSNSWYLLYNHRKNLVEVCVRGAKDHGSYTLYPKEWKTLHHMLALDKPQRFFQAHEILFQWFQKPQTGWDNIVIESRRQEIDSPSEFNTEKSLIN